MPRKACRVLQEALARDESWRSSDAVRGNGTVRRRSRGKDGWPAAREMPRRGRKQSGSLARPVRDVQPETGPVTHRAAPCIPSQFPGPRRREGLG